MTGWRVFRSHHHQMEPAGSVTASPEGVRRARKEARRLEREREREGEGEGEGDSQTLERMPRKNMRRLKNRFRHTTSIWRSSDRTTRW